MNTNLAYKDIEKRVSFLPVRQLLHLQMKISELILAKTQLNAGREKMSEEEARNLFEHRIVFQEKLIISQKENLGEMKNMDILLDSNIILDWLQQREPFYQNARKIVESCMFGNLAGFVTSHSLCDMYYILRKDFSLEQRLNFIRLISERCTVITENANDFIAVTNNPVTKDLEDGLQMQCAAQNELNYIVTRNIKDFTDSSVPAIMPEDFIAMLGL